MRYKSWLLGVKDDLLQGSTDDDEILFQNNEYSKYSDGEEGELTQ